jgi:oligosaccharide repeat unit polymerase
MIKPNKNVNSFLFSNIFLAHALVLGLLICSVSFLLNSGIEPEPVIYPACTGLVALFLWALWSWKKSAETLFDPYSLFLMAAVFFNGGQAFLEILRLNENGILSSQFTNVTIMETLLLVLLGIASFHFGALSSFAIRKNVRVKASREKGYWAGEPQALRAVGWGMILASIVPTLVLLQEAITTVQSFGYFGLYGKEASTSFGAIPKVLATFLIPGALFLLAGSKGRKKDILISALLIFSYSFVQFYLGYRGWAVMPLIAFAWLWHRLVRPLPKTVLLVSATFFLFVVFPLVASIRNIAGFELSSSNIVDQLFGFQNPVVASISEMGGSMQTVAYTLELVPSVRDFDRGIGYLYALFSVIPNIWGGGVHPSAAYLPSQWLSWAISPLVAKLGGGLGYSFIAEAYLNFGWVGTPLVLGLMGFFLGRMVLWAKQVSHPGKLALTASLMSFFLYFPRGEFGTVVRASVWYCLVPYLMLSQLNKMKSDRHGRHLPPRSGNFKHDLL